MSTFSELCHFAGGLTATRITVPASSIADAQVAAGANVSANKLVNRFRQTYGQPGGSASTTERKAVYVAVRALARYARVRAPSLPTYSRTERPACRPSSPWTRVTRHT